MSDDRCPACLQPFPECTCSKYCIECGCRSNHTAAFHREMESEIPKEPTR